jgi:pimeloyl-ACP methyl ester carboxylesterase
LAHGKWAFFLRFQPHFLMHLFQKAPNRSSFRFTVRYALPKTGFLDYYLVVRPTVADYGSTEEVSMASSSTRTTGSSAPADWSAPPVPTRFVGANGLTLRASRYGEFTAPIVLLLHGGGQTRHAWTATARHLAAVGYCAITLDARGHGDSDWCPRGDYSAQALAADLEAVIRSLPGEPIIVGASMGGLTALLALGEESSLNCAALVLVDVAPQLEPRGVRRVIEFMRRHQNGFETLQQVRDAIAAYNPHRPPPKDLSGLRKNLRQRSDGRFYWHWDPAFLDHAKAPADAGSMFDRARLEEAATRLDMPVLLIRGFQSDVLSDQGAHELLTLIPQARYIVLEQAGHMVAGDRNNVFTEAVLKFLHDGSPAATKPALVTHCDDGATP